MEREKQLAKNTLIITASKLLTQATNFLLLPLYTAKLSPTAYGIVDLFNTYIYLLSPLITLQLENALFRFLVDVRANEEGKEKYISTITISVLINSLIALVVIGFLGFYIKIDYWYFLAINVFFTVGTNLLLQIARGLGNNKIYAFGNALMSIITVVLNVVFIVLFNLGAEGLFGAYLIAHIVAIIYIFIKTEIYKYTNIKKFELKVLKELLNYSIPLIPNQLSWWIINASDRTIISSFINIAANGVYSVANRFSTAYITFYNIFNVAWQESAALSIEDEDSGEYFSKIINSMFDIFSIMLLLILSIMPFIFSFLVNEKFSEAYNLIPILMIGAFLNIIVGLISVVYIAKKQTKKLANTSIAAGLINLILDLIFVKKFGLYASAGSNVIAFLILVIYRYLDVQKSVKIKFDARKVLFFTGLTTITLLSYYQPNIYMQVIVLFIVIIYGIFINLKSIKIIKKIISRKFIR